MTATNLFVPEQYQNSVGRASQIATSLIKNQVKPCNEISKTQNGKNLNLLLKQFAIKTSGKKADKND